MAKRERTRVETFHALQKYKCDLRMPQMDLEAVRKAIRNIRRNIKRAEAQFDKQGESK
jgi:hypothetical protein